MNWLTFDLPWWVVLPVVVVLIAAARTFLQRGEFLLLVGASLFMHFAFHWTVWAWILWIPLAIVVFAFVVRIIAMGKKDKDLSFRSLDIAEIALVVYSILFLWQVALVPLWHWVTTWPWGWPLWLFVAAGVVVIAAIILKPRSGRAAFAAVVVALLLAITAGIIGYSGSNSDASPSPSATTETSSSPSPSPSATTDELNAKAATWVLAMYLNFEDAGEPPTECAAYEPDVDLTEIHYYATEEDKESVTAFGPDMGDTPCEVTQNYVERLYKDPFFVLKKAKEIKEVDPSFDFEVYSPEEQASVVRALADAPFSEREALADQVLGWYADSSRVLSLSEVDGAYTSEGADTAEDGTTTSHSSEGDKSSTVMTVKDRDTGETVKEDRADCGGQPYHRVTPPVEPPTTPPTTCQDKAKPNDPEHTYTPVRNAKGCIISWKQTGSSLNDGPQHQDVQTDRGNQEQAQEQSPNTPTTPPAPNPVAPLPDTDDPEVIESSAPDPTPGGYDGGSTSQPGASGTPDPGPSQPAVEGDSGGF